MNIENNSDDKKNESIESIVPKNNMFVSEAKITFKCDMGKFESEGGRNSLPNQLSEAVYAREMPWKILIQKRSGQQSRNWVWGFFIAFF